MPYKPGTFAPAKMRKGREKMRTKRSFGHGSGQMYGGELIPQQPKDTPKDASVPAPAPVPTPEEQPFLGHVRPDIRRETDKNSPVNGNGNGNGNGHNGHSYSSKLVPPPPEQQGRKRPLKRSTVGMTEKLEDPQVDTVTTELSPIAPVQMSLANGAGYQNPNLGYTFGHWRFFDHVEGTARERMKLNEDKAQEALYVLRDGGSLGDAADMVGVDRDTIRKQVAKNPLFAAAVKMAQAVGTMELVRRVKYGDRFWQSAAWMLERTRRKRFSLTHMEDEEHRIVRVRTVGPGGQIISQQKSLPPPGVEPVGADPMPQNEQEHKLYLEARENQILIELEQIRIQRQTPVGQQDVGQEVTKATTGPEAGDVLLDLDGSEIFLDEGDRREDSSAD